MSEKKNCARGWLGYCPFFLCARSQYNKLYRDTARLGARQGGQDKASSAPRQGQQGAMTRPAYAQGKRQHAHGAWPLGVCHDTKFCIVTRCSETGCDTAQQRVCALRKTARSTRGMACITIQFLYREGEDSLVSQHSARHGLQYGAQRPAIRRRSVATCAAAHATRRGVRTT